MQEFSPKVQFVDGLIINVGRDGRDVAVRVAVCFLLVADEVLLTLSVSTGSTLQALTGPIQLTFTLVITPVDCTPTTVSYASCPVRKGSFEKPSQFRPLEAILPRGPTTGPSITLEPFLRNSWPIPTARSWANARFHDAPTDHPAAHAETKSALRKPFPASERHSPGKLRRGTEAMKPEQPVDVVVPPVRLTYRADRVSLELGRVTGLFERIRSCDRKHTFSSSVICPTRALALLYASAQSPLPVPFGLGYIGGLWP